MITVCVTYPIGLIQMCFTEERECAEVDCDEMEVDGIFAMCNDCRNYLECKDGLEKHHQCPLGQHFNVDTRQCQSKSPHCYPCSGRLHILL